MGASILHSDIDIAFFFQNVHIKHRDMTREHPALLDINIPDILLAHSPRAVRKPSLLASLSVVWVLITAKPDFEAPSRAKSPKTIREMLNILRKVEFNPNGSLFDEREDNPWSIC